MGRPRSTPKNLLKVYPVEVFRSSTCPSSLELPSKATRMLRPFCPWLSCDDPETRPEGAAWAANRAPQAENRISERQATAILLYMGATSPFLKLILNPRGGLNNFDAPRHGREACPVPFHFGAGGSVRAAGFALAC